MVLFICVCLCDCGLFGLLQCCTELASCLALFLWWCSWQQIILVVMVTTLNLISLVAPSNKCDTSFVALGNRQIMVVALSNKRDPQYTFIHSSDRAIVCFLSYRSFPIRFLYPLSLACGWDKICGSSVCLFLYIYI